MGGYYMEKSDEIFRISKDVTRARDLIDMAKERLNKVIKTIPESLPYKFLEEYYEIAVQFMTSIMYSEGYKTLSHVALIKFLSKHGFKYNEIKTLDNMRKFRHGIVYYGRKEGGNFYINHKEEIKEIIEKLVNLAEKLSN
jgi:hypothetical protein